MVLQLSAIRTAHAFAIGFALTAVLWSAIGVWTAWITATAVPNAEVLDVSLTLWEVTQKLQTPNGTVVNTAKVSDMESNDKPYCNSGKGPSNKTQKQRLQLAQVTGVLALVTALSFTALSYFRAVGKCVRGLKYVPLFAGIVSVGMALVCVSSWGAFYHACDKTYCEEFESTYKGDGASCGPFVGQIFMAATVPAAAAAVIVLYWFLPKCEDPALGAGPDGMATGVVVAGGVPPVTPQVAYGTYETGAEAYPSAAPPPAPPAGYSAVATRTDPATDRAVV